MSGAQDSLEMDEARREREEQSLKRVRTLRTAGKKNNCGINEFVKHFMIGEFGKLCDDKDEQSCVLESF